MGEGQGLRPCPPPHPLPTRVRSSGSRAKALTSTACLELMMNNNISNLVDFICLLYHEARNVRHPIKAGKLSNESKYSKLLTLPPNRDKAWQQMGKLRNKAASFSQISEIRNLFQNVYGISIEELLILYQEPCWKGSLYGGNKWAPICSKIIELLEAIESGDNLKSSKLFAIIPKMEHNTGTVEKKLRRLKGLVP